MIMKPLTSAALLILTLSVLPGTVTAAESYPAIIANDGIAFSRMDEGQMIAYDTVAAYDEHQILVANCSLYQAAHQGVSWCFASEENKQSFLAAITDNGRNHYLPFGGGHCAMGLSLGNFVARGDPRTALRIGDQLVLNGNLSVRTRFLMDTERNLDNARLQYQLALRNGSIVDNAKMP